MSSLNRILFASMLIFSLPSFASNNELKDCLAQSGEVAPNAESLALAVSGALTKDKFLHRAYLSPMEYRMLDAKKLAEMLVARLNEECEGPRTKPDAKPVDSEVVMMVNSHNLEAIAKYGFQNQHATGSSNGSDAAQMRFETEKEMVAMELPYGAKMREVLPKYSAINLKSANHGTFALPFRYGDVALVFGPSVKKRTTFTFRDSLATTAREGSGVLRHFPPHTMEFKPSGDPASAGICSGYCEAQIWGPVDFTDVAYLMIKKGKEIPEAAKKLGIPIYEMEAPESKYYGQTTEVVAPDAAAQYKRGELLLPASEAPARAQAFTKQELKTTRATLNPDSAVAKILEGRILSEMPEAELIELYKAAPTKISEDYFGPTDPNVKLFAELATRPHSPAVQELLLKEVNSVNPLLRREALLGLSDLPPARLKPILLAALTDKHRKVQATAIAIALDSNDPEILQAAKSRYEPSEVQLSNPNSYWAYKLWKRKKYCAPD